MRLDGLASSLSSVGTLRNMGLKDASESFTTRLVNACRQHSSTSSTADEDSYTMKVNTILGNINVAERVSLVRRPSLRPAVEINWIFVCTARE